MKIKPTAAEEAVENLEALKAGAYDMEYRRGNTQEYSKGFSDGAAYSANLAIHYIKRLERQHQTKGDRTMKNLIDMIEHGHAIERNPGAVACEQDFGLMESEQVYLIALYMEHEKDARVTGWIDDFLTEINFHTLNRALSAHDYRRALMVVADDIAHA